MSFLKDKACRLMLTHKTQVWQRPLSRDAVKLIMTFNMLLNHIAVIFLEEGTLPCEILKAIGYSTAPAMLYFLVEGYEYTHSKSLYLKRLLFFAVLSEGPYYLAFGADEGFFNAPFNMLVTLSVCFAMMWGIGETGDPRKKTIIAAAGIMASFWCDWGLLAPFMTLAFMNAKGQESRLRRTFAGLILLFGMLTFTGGIGKVPLQENLLFSCLDMGGMGLAAAAVLCLYNGKRAEKGRSVLKWFFYAFYPAHLLILGLIRVSG